MSDPHPHDEDPEEHIGEELPDPWTNGEWEVKSNGVGDRTEPAGAEPAAE